MSNDFSFFYSDFFVFAIKILFIFFIAQLFCITYTATLTDTFSSKNFLNFFYFIATLAVFFFYNYFRVGFLIEKVTLSTLTLLFLICLLFLYTLFLLYNQDAYSFRKIFYEPFCPFLLMITSVVDYLRGIPVDVKFFSFWTVFILAAEPTVTSLSPETVVELLADRSVARLVLSCDRFDSALLNGEFGPFNIKNGFGYFTAAKNSSGLQKLENVFFSDKSTTDFDNLYESQIQPTYEFIRRRMNYLLENNLSFGSNFTFSKLKLRPGVFSSEEKRLLLQAILDLSKDIPINTQNMAMTLLSHPFLIRDISLEYSAIGSIAINVNGHFLTHFTIPDCTCSINNDSVFLDFTKNEKILSKNEDFRFFSDVSKGKLNLDLLERLYGKNYNYNFYRTLHSNGQFLITPEESFNKLKIDRLTEGLQYRYRNLPVPIGFDSNISSREQQISLRPIQFVYTSKPVGAKQNHLFIVLKPRERDLYKNLLTNFSQCQQFDSFSKNIVVKNCDYKISAEMAQTVIKLFKK